MRYPVRLDLVKIIFMCYRVWWCLFKWLMFTLVFATQPMLGEK